MKYRENLIFLLLSILYTIMAIFPGVLQELGMGAENWKSYCLSASVTFIILFISLISLFFKSIDSRLKVGILLIFTAILVGLIWSILRNTGVSSSLTGYFIFIWPIPLIIGFSFIIYSFFKPVQEKIKEDLKKEILEELKKE